MRVLVDDVSTGGLDELANCTRCTHECFRGCDCGRTVQAAVHVSATEVLAGPVPSGYTCSPDSATTGVGLRLRPRPRLGPEVFQSGPARGFQAWPADPMLMPRWFGSMASVCVSVSNHLCVSSVSQASGIVGRPERQLGHWCSEEVRVAPPLAPRSRRLQGLVEGTISWVRPALYSSTRDIAQLTESTES